MSFDPWLTIWDLLDNGWPPEQVFWELRRHMIEVDMPEILDIKRELDAFNEAEAEYEQSQYGR